MAEEIYFIKTNPTVAKINLYNKLCREEKNILDFLDDDKKTSLEIIKTKLQESINTCTQDELLSIYHWLYNTCVHTNDDKSEEEIKTQLFINGLDLFFEISSKSSVKSFSHVLSDYEVYIGHHLPFVSEAKDFNRFLIYSIFYTGKLKIFLNKHDHTNDTADDHVILMQLNMLKPNYKDLYEWAEKEFNTGFPVFENFINESQKLGEFHQTAKDSQSYSVPSELVPLLEKEKDIIATANLYHTLCGLYELTKYYKDPIIKLHT
jgi:hypothetical protein